MGFSVRNKTTNSDRNEVVITNETTGNYVNPTPNNELPTSDILNNGGDNTTITATTTAQELKVDASKRVNRKYVIFQPLGNNVLWGFTSGTQSFSVYKDQILMLPVGENTEVWLKTSSGSVGIAIGEVS